jgi:hypothetical protein
MMVLLYVYMHLNAQKNTWSWFRARSGGPSRLDEQVEEASERGHVLRVERANDLILGFFPRGKGLLQGLGAARGQGERLHPSVRGGVLLGEAIAEKRGQIAGERRAVHDQHFRELGERHFRRLRERDQEHDLGAANARAGHERVVVLGDGARRLAKLGADALLSHFSGGALQVGHGLGVYAPIPVVNLVTPGGRAKDRGWAASQDLVGRNGLHGWKRWMMGELAAQAIDERLAGRAGALHVDPG